MPLTQFAVASAAAKDKPYKLTDGDGSGEERWRGEGT
jgi:hypothetical protein